MNDDYLCYYFRWPSILFPFNLIIIVSFTTRYAKQAKCTRLDHAQRTRWHSQFSLQRKLLNASALLV